MGKTGGKLASGTPLDLSARLEEWRRQLLDTSKRSRLINCKFGRTGILAIEHPGFDHLWEIYGIEEGGAEFPWPSFLLGDDELEDEEPAVAAASEPAAEGAPEAPKQDRSWMSDQQLAACLQSSELNSDDIVARLLDRALDGRLKRMALGATTSLSEQGVNSLYLAFGFLRWYESVDSDVELVSPLLLVPASLSKESTDSKWRLEAFDEDILPNHSLAELLRSSFRLDLPEPDEDTLRGSVDAMREFLDAVRAAVGEHERWTVEPMVGLGTFGFQKISMWQDLRKNESHISSHALCRGIAGDMAAVGEVPQSVPPVENLDDATPLDASHLILDCDGSQLEAIRSVKHGTHLILDGPPGTGKSQTIANIIAECLAAGQTVLFVSEKAAALEVVKRRLDQSNLGDFCLECHSHKSNKRAVVTELGRCLNHKRESYPSQDAKLIELDRSRKRLNAYVKALHVRRSALNTTAYAMHGRLAHISVATSTRVVIRNIHDVNRSSLQAMEESVGRLALCGPIIANAGIHPWRGCRCEIVNLSFPDDVRFHFARAADGFAKRLDAAKGLVQLGFVSESPTLAQLVEAERAAREAASLPRIPPAWVGRGLDVAATQYQSMHEMAENYRITRSAVQAYSDSAIEVADIDLMQETYRASRDLRAVLSALPESIRDQAQYLELVARQVREVALAADEVATASARLLPLLALQNTPGKTVRDARIVASAARTICAAGPVPRSWFESDDRSRLTRIASECQQLSAMATTVRRPLEPRFQPVAFMSASASTIDGLLRHQSWFSRLGGAWRRARQSFSTLYAANAPKKSRELLDDAHQLRRYHECLIQLGQVGAGDRESLQWDGSPEFDWARLISRLSAMQSLAAQMQVDEGLRSMAATLDSILQTQLVGAANEVDQRISRLGDVVANLKQNVALRQVIGVDNADEVDTIAAPAALRRFADALDKQREGLSAIGKLLGAGQDVSAAGLGNDAQVFADLRQLHSVASRHAQAAGETLPPAPSGSLGDWSKQAKLSEWVQQFVKSHGGHPPKHVVHVLSDDAAATTLRRCLEALRSAVTAELRESWQFVIGAFARDVPVSGGITLAKASAQDLIAWLRERVRDADKVGEWTAFVSACTNLERLRLGVLRDEVLAGTLPAEQAVDVLRQRFSKLWLDEAYRNEPALREFDLAVHDQTIEKFRELDRFWIRNGFARIRTQLLENCPNVSRLGADAPSTSAIGILLREYNKKRRHLPLRRLFAQIPDLLLRIKPCIMMSPLAVSTYLDTAEIRFDVVIFDEASQVRPHDAVCAIYRARQLVVAGDQKQLPPTSFFERLTSEKDDEDDELAHSTSDYESILDVCATLGLPRQRLKWHYRSKRESLIAFSNRHFYAGELVTFPSVFDVHGASGVTLDYVTDGCWDGGAGSGTNAVEARHIAEQVMRHAMLHPEQTLGVTTMNQAQQMLVIDEIDRLRRSAPQCEAFFAKDNREPFFVKNLENVQGDERDVIFLGVCYAKNASGALSHNFGPLNRQGGERRLNVAVTRARESLVVFSSIKAQDIDLHRTQSIGARLLRAYLDFAERGPIALQANITDSAEAEHDSEFEAEVERALRERGLEVRRQIGCSGFRIDLALVDPERPGRYVLGIECDGATYHSSATARDRDRLRQDMLEKLGWRIARIWSTDWVRNPSRQIEKVLAAYQHALAAATVSPAPAVEAVVIEPVVHQDSTVPQDTPGIAPSFASIEEVPREVIRNLICDMLAQFGSMEFEDLLQSVARQLGFQRTGARIRDSLTREFTKLQRGGTVSQTDGRASLSNGSKPTNGSQR